MLVRGEEILVIGDETKSPPSPKRELASSI